MSNASPTAQTLCDSLIEEGYDTSLTDEECQCAIDTTGATCTVDELRACLDAEAAITRRIIDGSDSY